MKTTAAAIWSPIGSRLAISCEAGLEVLDVPSLRLVGRKPAGTRAVAFRGDGAALAVVTDRGLLAWDLASGALAPLTAVRVDGRTFSLSPDWRRLAVEDASGVVSIFDAASASLVATLAGGRAFGIVGLSWSPEGARIATAGQLVEVWDAATGSALGEWKLPADEAPAHAPPRWTADGATVFFGAYGLRKVAGGGRVHAGDARTFRLREGWRASNFAISPDGKTLFCSELLALYRINVATGARREIDFQREVGAPYVHAALALSGDVAGSRRSVACWAALISKRSTPLSWPRRERDTDL